MVFQFIWFSGCGIGIFSSAITSFFCLFFIIASLTQECGLKVFREEANIFVATMATTYLCYMNWSALASHPNETCNPFVEHTGNTFAQIIVGAVVTAVTVISIATASLTSDNKGKEAKASWGQEAIAEDVEGEAKAIDEEGGIFPVTIPTLIFQGVMLFSSAYYAMLFTNWGSVTVVEDHEDVFDASYAPMWIKLIALWFSIALYTVSITIQICCGDRIYI